MIARHLPLALVAGLGLPLLTRPAVAQSLGPLVLEYNATGEDDGWTTEPATAGAALLRTRGDLASPGAWIHYVYRVHVDPEYFEYDAFTAAQAAYLAELDPVSLVDLGFGPLYQGFPEIATDPEDFIDLLVYALFPVDPDNVNTFCLPTLRPDDPTATEAQTLWATDHFRWSSLASGWWSDYGYPGPDANIVNVEALAEFMILSQSKGDLDDSFFDTSYYKRMREEGLFLKVQAYGLQGALVDPTTYAVSDEPDGDVPGGLIGWTPLSPRVTTTAAVTLQMAFTSPAVGYPGWAQFDNQAAQGLVTADAPTTIRLSGRFANPQIRLLHSQGMSATAPLTSVGPGRARFSMPAWPPGVVRGTHLSNDVGERTLAPEDRYVFRLL